METDYKGTIDLHRNVRFFLSGGLLYGGGGERIALQIVDYLSSHLKDKVSLIEHAKSISETRWNTNEIKQPAEFRSVKYENINLLKFLYQPMPPSSEYLPLGINMVMIYRIPSKRYLSELVSKQIPVIFLIHGISFEKIRFSNLVIDLYQIYLRFILRGNGKLLRDKIFRYQVLTTDAVNFLTRWGGINKDQIYLIENGLNYLSNCPSSTLDHFTVLFIGRMSNLQKGLRLLAKVSVKLKKRNLPNLRIIIAGSGLDSHIITSAAKRCDILKYLGYIDEKKKGELLCESSLFLCTSNLDPFSIATVEALQSGLPVVTVPVSGPTNLVNKNSIYGKVSKYSSKSIVDEIVKFYTFWEKDKLAYNNQKLMRSKIARDEFSLFDMQEGYIKMIAKTAEDRYSTTISYD